MQKKGKPKIDFYLGLMDKDYNLLWLVNENHPRKDALCLNHKVMYMTRMQRVERMYGKERVISVQQITPKPLPSKELSDLGSYLREDFPRIFDELIKEYAP